MSRYVYYGGDQMIKLIMFGLDGVLLDYQKILKESFNETLKKYGYPTLTDSKRYYFDNLPIEGQGAFGVLNAEGFKLVDKGKTIYFTGKSKLVLHPGARRSTK